MVALYVASSEAAAGKTAIGAGVGKHLLGDGRKVGFLKPIIADKKPAAGSDGDAAFMKQVLGLPEPVDSLCPLISGEGFLANKVKEVYAKVSQGKDVIIVEGMCGQSLDDSLSKTSYEIAGALKAKVIVVEGYSNQSMAKSINSYKGFGENLLGIVLNKVPVSQLKRVSDEISPQFDEAGVTILGVIPEDRVLLTLTVGELANSIQGEIINNAEKSAELVGGFMVGAMCVDSGLEYFGRKANKAAVVRDDRPDMQMAALETSTRCLVISGNTGPIDYVRYKAEDEGVPIILTKNDTGTIVKSIEDALGKARFTQEKKLLKLAEIMEKHLDFQAIYRGLGI